MTRNALVLTPVLNYINGEWRTPGASEYADVINPATGGDFGPHPALRRG